MARHDEVARELRRRRAAMIWLLRANGYTQRKIGELMGVSGGRVAQILSWYERLLRQRAYSTDEQRPFEKRLRAAGAIPDLPPRLSRGPHPMNVFFVDMDLPEDP